MLNKLLSRDEFRNREKKNMRKEIIKQKIKEYLESNEGNINMNSMDLHSGTNTEVIAEKIMEIVCDQVAHDRYHEALDRKFSSMR